MKKILIVFGILYFLCMQIYAQDKPYYINVSTTNDSVTCSFGYWESGSTPVDSIKIDFSIENNSDDTIYISDVDFSIQKKISNTLKDCTITLGWNRDFNWGYPSPPFKSILPKSKLEEKYSLTETANIDIEYGRFMLTVVYVYYLDSEKLKRVYGQKDTWHFDDSYEYEYFELHEKQRRYWIGSIL